MITKQFLTFLVRVMASCLGMWFCISFFGSVDHPASTLLFIAAGVIFSLINAVLKPLMKIMALPFAIITMGISTILINTAMIALTIKILPGVTMPFWGEVVSSFLLSVINGLVNTLVLEYNKD